MFASRFMLRQRYPLSCFQTSRPFRPSSLISPLATHGDSLIYTPNAQNFIHSDSDPHSSNSSSTVRKIVDKLNFSLEHHPKECVLFMFGSDISSIFLAYSLINASGMEISPEFAIAFAASRPLRKVRLPLEIAAAAVISKAFPDVARVQLTSLFNAFSIKKALSKPNSVPSSAPASFLEKSASKFGDVLDNYGAGYMIASRFVGVTIVFSLYYMIKAGVDVMPILEKFGVEEVGSAMGTWAAAVVLSSTVYPATLASTGYIAPWLAKGTQKLFSRMK